MSKLSIIAVGKLPSEYREIFDHFMHMLGKDLQVHEIIIKKNISGPEIMEPEGMAILEKIRPQDYVILLDVMGKKCDSKSFSNLIAQTISTNNICFVIGGAWGVSSKIKSRANIAFSLSELTFSHMLARVILLEQIYRAKSIIAGHPYHKE